jgi:hypothetical protein
MALTATGPRFRVAAAALASAAIVGMGGCSDSGGEDVASLGDAGPSASASTQRLAAEAYHSCLVDAGLPAEIFPVNTDEPDGDAWVSFGAAETVQVIPGEGGMTSVSSEGAGGSGGGSGITEEEREAFLEAHQDPESFGLLVDGVDRSADFERCYTESGYTEPEFTADPAAQALFNTRIAEATNTWIACARENGYPDLSDVAASSEDPDYYPNVELPSTITEEALRALLDACPNFDAEAWGEMLDAQSTGTMTEANIPTDPAISIAQPPESMNGDAAATERWEKLNEILWEKQAEFYESRGDGEFGIVGESDLGNADD